MSDPFLAAHETLPHVFVLTDLRPTSLRDQLLRAVRVVEGLVQAGRMGDQRSLAVVGGGAAGAAAAMLAVSNGSHVTLIDARARLFRLQFGKRSRFVQPAQYDWPNDHFAGPAMPFSSGMPKSPLPLQPGVPYRIARQWEYLFQESKRSASGALQVIHNATATPSKTSGRPLVEWGTGSSARRNVFDEVVWATGRATENTTIFGPGGGAV